MHRRGEKKGHFWHFWPPRIRVPKGPLGPHLPVAGEVTGDPVVVGEPPFGFSAGPAGCPVWKAGGARGAHIALRLCPNRGGIQKGITPQRVDLARVDIRR